MSCPHENVHASLFTEGQWWFRCSGCSEKWTPAEWAKVSRLIKAWNLSKPVPSILPRVRQSYPPKADWWHEEREVED